jgi:hypothetical protein
MIYATTMTDRIVKSKGSMLESEPLIDELCLYVDSVYSKLDSGEKFPLYELAGNLVHDSRMNLGCARSSLHNYIFYSKSPDTYGEHIVETKRKFYRFMFDAVLLIQSLECVMKLIEKGDT